jgi:hypothetical protein
MAMKSICEAFPVQDPKADYRNAARIGNCRIGAKAIYFPGFPGEQYLPLAALRRAWIQKSSIATKCCCGAQLPVFVLRVRYDGGFFRNFTFDQPEQADTALSMILDQCPGLPSEAEKP